MQSETGLIPPWTAEDFATEKPYAWLYSMKLSRFDQRRMLNALIECGTRLGVKKLTIQQYWNDYQADQKPAKLIGSNAVAEFPEQERVLGKDKTLSSGKYLCDANGVSYIGPMGEWIQVIAHPLLPIRRIVDVETNLENLKLAYCRVIQGENNVRAEWREIITPRETLASAQRIITLARNGIAVNSENAKEVVKYIAEIENLNYSQLETQHAASHMGWLPDGRFSPFADDVVYGGNSEEFARLYSSFHPEGDYQTWLDRAKKVRAGASVPARIALAASFAAPLVQKLGALSFFVHLWGLQGSGKTVALMFAASVWCNPMIGGYIRSFNGTKVAQEQMASFCGNLPVFLDELQAISDRKSFDDIIYSLCEGVSKGRGAKEGGLQTSARWATVFLTTGEMPIVQSNSGGGAAVRTIEINYGGEPFFDDARSVANTCRNNYGFAGRQFIEALSNDETMDALRETQKMYYAKLSGDIQDKQVLSASLLLAADKLADIVIFKDGRSLTVSDIKPYLITQEQADINERCYQYLVGWIASNQSRFSDDAEVSKGQQWGVVENYREWDCDVAYIIRNVFESALRDGGFSPGAFLNWAKRKNILRTQRPDSNTIQKTIGGMRPLCVAFRLPQQDAKTNYVEVKDDDDMPF